MTDRVENQEPIPNKYLPLWEMAKPYYERGRPMDIDHIEWMMRDGLYVCSKEPQVDEEILLPTVILHDVGYAEVDREDYYNVDVRRAHMKAGAAISRKILEQLKYPAETIEKVSGNIAIHDNWAFGDVDIYRKDIVLGVFKDLDWIWTSTGKGFPAVMKVRNCSVEEMLSYISDPNTKVPPEYFTPTTEELFNKYLAERQNEYRKS